MPDGKMTPMMTPHEFRELAKEIFGKFGIWTWDDLFEMNVKVKIADGYMPMKKTVGSAAYDVHAAESGIIPAGGHQLVRLGFSTEFPKTMVGIMRDRSGLALSNQIFVTGGIIDSDYRGEWKVILNNGGLDQFRYKRGDRIAQVLFVQLSPCLLVPVGELSDTDRGSGGFGSTGLKQIP